MDGDRRPGVDVWLLAGLTALAAFGVLNLASLGESNLAVHQAATIAVALALLPLLVRTRPPTWAWLGRVTYIVAVALLTATALAGIETNGARRWLSFGSLAFQPSELAKLGVLLVLADVLGAKPHRRHRVITALALAAVPIGLTLAEPDLSTSFLLVVITVAALVVARVRLRTILGLAACLVALAPVVEVLLRPYQSARLHAFLSGGADPLGSGWELLQAHIAVGSAGLLSGQRVLPHDLLASYLPARESDLAFASLIEQRGLLLGAAVLLAAAIVVWRLVALGLGARTSAGGIIAVGLGALIGIEVVVSVSGNLGVLPIAGVPAPLLSSGGTAAVVHAIAAGIAMATRRDAAQRLLWRPPRVKRRPPRLSRTTVVALTGALAALVFATVQLQARQGPSLQAVALEQATRSIRLPASRGVILDRHGAVLATDDGTVDVLAIPRVVESDRAALEVLAGDLGVTSGSLRRDLAVGGLDVRVAARQPEAVARSLAAARLPGVLVVPSGGRMYPTGSLLAPVLGFVGVATPDDIAALGPLPPGTIVGRAGMERQADMILRGSDGFQRVLVNPQGDAVGLSSSVAPQPGASLAVTIDLGLQQAATSALASALRGVPGQPRGDEGAVVVMDARSGQLLALASLPAYDDNILGPPVDEAALRQALAAPGDPFLEHATQTQAPPGSTFKLVLGATDVADGVVAPSRVVPTGATFTYDGVTFHNWTGLPPQDLPRAIAWSNDVYFYKLALALGPERIADVARQIGAGVPTGVDLPGEASGLVGTPSTVSTWYPGTTVLLGIGQGPVTATPLQVARWTDSVASGTLVTPRLELATTTPDAGAAAIPAPAPQSLGFASTLGPVRSGLRLAVTEGTGTQLRALSVAAGGKTGSAEDPSTPGGVDAWYTAVAPVSSPDVVVTVLVRGGGEGFNTAEPVALSVLQYYEAHRDAILASVLTGRTT